jgi:hypothetical protein
MQVGQQVVQQHQKCAPSTNPPPAGRKHAASGLLRHLHGGISSDHTEAAIITPAANPRKTRWVRTDISFFEEKHHGGAQHRDKAGASRCDGRRRAVPRSMKASFLTGS